MLAHAVKARLRDMRTYFRHSRQDITEKNLRSLKTGCVGGFILFVLLIIITPYIVKGWQPTKEYWVMVPTFLLFIAFTYAYPKFFRPSYYVVQTACVAFCSMMLGHFILISTFPYPEAPQTYLTVFLLLIPIVFIVRPYVMEIVLIAAIVIYYLIAKEVKPPQVLSNDIFACIMSAAFSQVCMAIVYSLRIDDFNSREVYKQRSRMDLLTGVLNKRSFENSCQRLLRDGAGKGANTLLVFDVDFFKELNDSKGHLKGDRALELVGEAMSREFRASDVVGRIGGDEFGAFVRGLDDSERAAELVKRVQDRIRLEAVEKLGMDLGVSAGAVISRGDNFSQLYSEADKALYSCKEKRRGEVEIRLL